MKNITKILFAFFLLGLLLVSGCENANPTPVDNSNNQPAATTTPVIEKVVAIGESDVTLGNWDSDPEDDGYYVWFTLKNSEGEIIAADGKASFSIIKDGSEIRRTNDIEVKASDFSVRKLMFGKVEKEALVYWTKFETDKIDHSVYSVMFHFTTLEGKQLSVEELRG